MWFFLVNFVIIWSIWYVKAETFAERLSQVGLDIVSFSNKNSISRYEVARLLNAANCQDCIQAPEWMKQTYTQNFWNTFRAIDWKDFDDVNFGAWIWNKKSYYYCVAYVWDNGYMAWYPSTSTKCKWNFCGQDMITTSEFYQTVLNIIQNQIKSKYLIDWPKVKTWKKWLKRNSIQMKVLNETNISAIDKADSKVWYAQTNDEFQTWLKFCMYNLSACNFQPFGVVGTWYWPVSELNILYKEWIITLEDAKKVASFSNIKWDEAIRIFSSVYDNFASCSFNVDYDCDGVTNWDDDCPYVFNSNQYDLDGDWIWNVCDDDIDGDWQKNSVWIVDDNNHIVVSLRKNELDQTPLGNLDLWFSFFVNIDAISTWFPTNVRFFPLTNWNISKIERDFGDWTKEIVNNWNRVNHTYRNSGFFTVKAVATAKNWSQSFATNKIFISSSKVENYALNIHPNIVLRNWKVEYVFTPLYSGDLNRIVWNVNNWNEKSYKVSEKYNVIVENDGIYYVTAKWYKNWELKAVAMFTMIQRWSPMFSSMIVNSANLWEKTSVISNFVWVLKKDVDNISINWWNNITKSTNIIQNYVYEDAWLKTIQHNVVLKDGSVLSNVATITVQNPLLTQSYAVNVSWNRLGYNQNEKLSLWLSMYPRTSILSLFTSYQIGQKNFLYNPNLFTLNLDYSYSSAWDKLLTNLVEVNRCVSLMNQWTVHINSLDICEVALKNWTLSKYKCDQDWDKIPDICDDDIDWDGVKNLIGIILKEKSDCSIWVENVDIDLLKQELWVCSLDNCFLGSNSNQSDLNNNWIGDLCESMMSDLLSNSAQSIGENSLAVDRDQDWDGVPDSMDSCVDVPWNSYDGCPRYYVQNCWVNSTCWNGKVEGWESCRNCPQDVWVCCWNWILDPLETCKTCSIDVWNCAECWNWKVENWETCENCPQDLWNLCVPFCGDGKYEKWETCENCPEDLWDKCKPGPRCGDGTVDKWENCMICEEDLEECIKTCGNGKYDEWETCENCPQDMKECVWSCGNGEKENPEECDNWEGNGKDGKCTEDCKALKQYCGNGKVEWGEECDKWKENGKNKWEWSCTVACTYFEEDKPECGDGEKKEWENCMNCAIEYGEICMWRCGDWVMNMWEECDNWEENGRDGKCTFECKETKDDRKYCGNNIVEKGEECDLWGLNGNGICGKDCKRPKVWKCGDWVLNEWEECDNWENNGKEGVNCDKKCKYVEECKNGKYEKWETCENCPEDLWDKCKPGPRCGDGTVDEWENCIECPEDVWICVWFCGNGKLDVWEECDPKDEIKQNWWDYGCSDLCKINTSDEVVCNSEYDWKVLSELDSLYNLCLKWNVKNFKLDGVKWTWLCVSGKKIVECAAQKTYCWDGILWGWENCENCPEDGKDSCYDPDIPDDWHIENDNCNMCPCEYVDFSTDLTKWDVLRASLWDETFPVFYKYSNSVAVETFLNIN